MSTISHCLWFDGKAEQAAKFYTSIFKNGKIGKIARYGKEGFEIHGQPEGTVMTVEFEIDGMKYLGLNGGPIFKFTEAFSIVVNCDTQEEIDYFWGKLTQGGQEVECGWLKDQFGVSWQINPKILGEMLSDPDPRKVGRVTEAFLKMKKFDIAALRRAFEGKAA
jgi:predicted 3-demethylubiquinone-9 3-methyltransferase (glyoxalase superfamily)